MFTVEDDSMLTTAPSSSSSTVSSSSLNEVLTAQEKRRISQARHRHNVAACYKNLREVLPQQDINLVPKRLSAIRNSVAPSGFPRVINNKATVLNRAKFYAQHLESVLGMLLEEKNQIKKKADKLDMAGTSTLFQNKSDKFSERYDVAQLTSISDVKESFLQNFTVNKPVLDYKFYFKAPIKAEVTSSDEDEDVADSKIPNFAPRFSTPYGMSQSMFVPFNTPLGPQNSFLINPTLKPSPAHSNEDLGFVSAGTGSQESNVPTKEEFYIIEENNPCTSFNFAGSSLFSHHF